jgi:hypothetical protein
MHNELKDFIKEQSAHLKFNQIEFQKRLDFKLAIYSNGVIQNQSNDFKFHREYCQSLHQALVVIEQYLNSGRTINKEKCKKTGSALDLYFNKTNEEKEVDLQRLTDQVKTEYKSELAQQRKGLIAELTKQFEAQLSDEASKQAQEKMKFVQSQLAELFE